jgi:cholesterol oxidase
MRNLTLPLINMSGSPYRRFLSLAVNAIRRPLDLFTIRFFPGWAEKNTVILVMQTIENRMRLKRGRSIWTLFRKGLVSERDKSVPIPAVIDAGRKVVDRFAERARGAPWSGINDVLLNTPSTAHILGGCGIGADESKGVINANHEVFNYPGLYVADGSAIPANLGINPSLTITAMTERAMSLVPPADELVEIGPLPVPADYLLSVDLRRHNRRRKLALFGLATIPITIMAAKFLFRKS